MRGYAVLICCDENVSRNVMKNLPLVANKQGICSRNININAIWVWAENTVNSGVLLHLHHQTLQFFGEPPVPTDILDMTKFLNVLNTQNMIQGLQKGVIVFQMFWTPERMRKVQILYPISRIFLFQHGATLCESQPKLLDRWLLPRAVLWHRDPGTVKQG